jgi:hypothetical protein
VSGDSDNTVGRVFISYARTDADHVDILEATLEAEDIPVWRDTSSLLPGDNWPEKVHTAIAHEALFCLICFSSASIARGKGYQNEEIVQAIEQLRLRHSGETWLIPVKFDECEIPDLSLGGGRTLATIHCADLFGSRYDEEAAKLIEVISRRLRGSARHRKTSPGVVSVPKRQDDRPVRSAVLSRRAAAIGAGTAGSLIAALAVVALPGLLSPKPAPHPHGTPSATASATPRSKRAKHSDTRAGRSPGGRRVPVDFPAPTLQPSQSAAPPTQPGHVHRTHTAQPSTPAPATYWETTGGITDTWSDYSDAGGNGGPQIPGNTKVQVACRVQGFQVRDRNTWWYKVASSPWDGNFYASADAFYNNGRTSGSLTGTPFYDPAVPVC